MLLLLLRTSMLLLLLLLLLILLLLLLLLLLLSVQMENKEILQDINFPGSKKVSFSSVGNGALFPPALYLARMAPDLV